MRDNVLDGQGGRGEDCPSGRVLPKSGHVRMCSALCSGTGARVSSRGLASRLQSRPKMMQSSHGGIGIGAGPKNCQQNSR
jgi:hypothetical protein